MGEIVGNMLPNKSNNLLVKNFRHDWKLFMQVDFIKDAACFYLFLETLCCPIYLDKLNKDPKIAV